MSPCGCMYVGTARKYLCDECQTGCRERIDSVSTFLTHFEQSKDIRDVSICHKADILDLPLVLPIKGGKNNIRISAKIAAVDLVELLAFFNTQNKGVPLYERARVDSSTILVGVLNSVDSVLERFWNLPNRVEFFTFLANAGIVAVTGPTFSLYDYYDGRPVPDSHKVLMLRRHHQVLSEIAEAGMVAIPNLYFRNQYDIDIWSDWLRKNDVRFIMRDFSMNKNPSLFLDSEVEAIKKMIISSGKSLHVLFTGVGTAKAESFLQQFAAIGCRCSFITSDPLNKAMMAGNRLAIHDGNLLSVPAPEIRRAFLVQPNYTVMEESLLQFAVSNFPILYKHSGNRNFGETPLYKNVA